VIVVVLFSSFCTQASCYFPLSFGCATAVPSGFLGSPALAELPGMAATLFLVGAIRATLH